MCNAITFNLDVAGSGKGANGWFPLRQAQVYLDHPFHAPLEEALMIDFMNHERGPSARVAVELSAESGRTFAGLVEEAVASGGLLCNPLNYKAAISGSGKGSHGWVALRQAQACQAVPSNAPMDEAILIDFLNEEQGASARVAVELDADSARVLVRLINEALATGHGH